MTDKASTLTPPKIKNGRRNLQLVAVLGAASAAKALQDEVRTRYVTVQALGIDVWVCFGFDNTVAVDKTLTGDQAPTANIGKKILSNTSQDFELEGETHIAVQGSADGTIELWGSGPRRTSGKTDEGP